MLTTILTVSLSFSAGYVFCAVWAVMPLNMRFRSKCSDLRDACDALAAHMAHIGNQRQQILIKDALIADLKAKADKWVPSRDKRGLFVKKAA